MPLLHRHAEELFAAMRIVTGFLFFMNGTQKLFGWPGGDTVPFPDIRWLAGVIELTGGTLVMIGLFTVPAAFICAGQMAVAYFWRHQPQGLWPILNRGELAALYCWVFLYISARGPGVWSVDRLARGGRR